jgi:hypothetical protein
MLIQRLAHVVGIRPAFASEVRHGRSLVVTLSTQEGEDLQFLDFQANGDSWTYLATRKREIVVSLDEGVPPPWLGLAKPKTYDGPSHERLALAVEEVLDALIEAGQNFAEGAEWRAGLINKLIEARDA